MPCCEPALYWECLSAATRMQREMHISRKSKTRRDFQRSFLDQKLDDLAKAEQRFSLHLRRCPICQSRVEDGQSNAYKAMTLADKSFVHKHGHNDFGCHSEELVLSAFKGRDGNAKGLFLFPATDFEDEILGIDAWFCCDQNGEMIPLQLTISKEHFLKKARKAIKNRIVPVLLPVQVLQGVELHQRKPRREVVESIQFQIGQYQELFGSDFFKREVAQQQEVLFIILSKDLAT